MASAAYNKWIASVKAQGGKVALPYVGPMAGKGPPKIPSAVYPFEVWGPKVNLGVVKGWPLPDEFSANGRLGYYYAPAELRQEMTTSNIATQKETASGAKQLMNQWGVPTIFQGLGNYIGTLVLIALIAGGAYIAISRRR